MTEREDEPGELGGEVPASPRAGEAKSPHEELGLDDPDEASIDGGDGSSWLDTEPETADLELRVDDEPSEDEASALDDTPADVADDELAVGDETRWTEGSEADHGGFTESGIDLGEESASHVDDGAEGLESDVLDLDMAGASRDAASDEPDEALDMGEAGTLGDEALRAALQDGEPLTAIGSIDGHGIEVRATSIRVGTELAPPLDLTDLRGAIALDEETLLAWSEDRAVQLSLVDGTANALPLAMRAATPDGRGGALILDRAGKVRRLEAFDGRLGPVIVTLPSATAIASVGSRAFLLADGRALAFEVGDAAALEPVPCSGAVLALTSDVRGRLWVAVGRGPGVVIERAVVDRAGDALRFEPIGSVEAAPSEVAAMAVLDRAVWLLRRGERVVISIDGPAEELEPHSRQASAPPR